jgi:hypothetical protein
MASASSWHLAIAGVTCRTHASSDGVVGPGWLRVVCRGVPDWPPVRVFFVSKLVLLFLVIENVGTVVVRHRLSGFQERRRHYGEHWKNKLWITM